MAETDQEWDLWQDAVTVAEWTRRYCEKHSIRIPAGVAGAAARIVGRPDNGW